jgi:hypothetical protein
MAEKTGPVQLSVPSFALERRVAVRYPCPPDTTYRVDTMEQVDSRWARICNVSTAGIALLLSGRVQRGTRLTIQVPSTRVEYAAGLVVRAVHSTLQEDGNWLIGCIFERPLDEDEMRELFL